MNRTIKFRGKRVINNEWVYGDLLHDYWNGAEQFVKTSIRFKNGDYYTHPVEVHPETVGQFTGLLDKDGKEVYEHDVVKVNKYGKVKEVSVYIDEDGVFPFAYKYTEWDGYDLSHNSEIIGNIHDTKQL